MTLREVVGLVGVGQAIDVVCLQKGGRSAALYGGTCWGDKGSYAAAVERYGDNEVVWIGAEDGVLVVRTMEVAEAGEG